VVNTLQKTFRSFDAALINSFIDLLKYMHDCAPDADNSCSHKVNKDVTRARA